MAAPLPITHTACARSYWSGVKSWPRDSGRLMIENHAGDVAIARQFVNRRLPSVICCCVSRSGTRLATFGNPLSRSKSVRFSPYSSTRDVRPLASLLSAGRSLRIRMFVAPNCSTCRRAASLPPWPSATITITASTPKMMPSAVSKDRKRCNIRLRRPRRKFSK